MFGKEAFLILHYYSQWIRSCRMITWFCKTYYIYVFANVIISEITNSYFWRYKCLRKLYTIEFVQSYSSVTLISNIDRLRFLYKTENSRISNRLHHHNYILFSFSSSTPFILFTRFLFLSAGFIFFHIIWNRIFGKFFFRENTFLYIPDVLAVMIDEPFLLRKIELRQNLQKNSWERKRKLLYLV